MTAQGLSPFGGSFPDSKKCTWRFHAGCTFIMYRNSSAFIQPVPRLPRF